MGGIGPWALGPKGYACTAHVSPCSAWGGPSIAGPLIQGYPLIRGLGIGYHQHEHGFPMPCTGIGHMGHSPIWPIWAPIGGPYGYNAYPKHGGIDVNMASKGPILGPKMGPFWGPPGQNQAGFIID